MMAKRTALLGIATFVVAAVSSLRLNGMVDGYTTMGFPITFLKYTGGKCVGCDQYFEWPSLAFDLFIAMAFAFCCLKAWRMVPARN